MRRLVGVVFAILSVAGMPVTGQEKAKAAGPAVASVRIRLHGKVTDIHGVPLTGANIRLKDTLQGAVSDLRGEFSLEASPDALLLVSFIGYQTETVPVRGREAVIVVLKENSIWLKSVVVTALGIEKEAASLPYSATEVSGAELTRVKNPNMLVGLTGKISGVQIHKSASGAGASARVLMRGMRSVAGNNQPLYVIDGVPILNATNEQAYTAIGGTADSGNRDGGDGVSNLNPEDIESLTVLKGAPAAALYGSNAANGVILITTKKGNSENRRIDFSTGLTWEKAAFLPEFQNTYGVSDGVESWGPRKDGLRADDNAGDFFRTGLTSVTSLSVTSGNKTFQNYFSYANTVDKGVMEGNRLMRHNLTLRETSSFFEHAVLLDGSINLIRQTVENRPPSGGFYMNPLVGLYRFPRGEDLSEYREHFEVYDPERNLNVQNWHSDTQDFEQNPYWVINRIRNKDRRNRIIASLSADWRVNDWLKIRTRGNMDYSSDLVRQQFYATTAPALAGANGRYIEANYEETLFYGDVMALFDRQTEQFSWHAAWGASVTDRTLNSLRYDSKTASLRFPNVFNIANIVMSNSAYIDQQIDARRQKQSAFLTAQLGYRERLFLDISLRNDWSSTLAYTSHEHSGFFYPSAGASWIVGKTFALPRWIGFGKLRAMFSRVGNDVPLFITHPVAHIGAGGEIQAADAAPFEDMKPEMTTAWEAGTEWRGADDRWELSVTYYRSNTENQFFKLPARSGDTYAYRYVNAGNIRNTGWEIAFGANPVRSNGFSWKTGLNYASNRNKVVRLHDELPVFIYGPHGFSSSYAMKLVEGGAFGDIYGKAFKRDVSGRILYETEGDRAGMPLVEGEGNLVKVGNCNPRFNLGWNHTLTFGNLTAYLLIDGRFGGRILSQTQADLDLFGVTRATAEARDRGYVELEGHRITDVKAFYKHVVGGRAGVTEYYMYDATNVRLRELSLEYRVPGDRIASGKAVKNIRLAFVARNLFFFYKKAPFDPDLVLSTGNDNQGIEVYGMPTTRSVGFTVKCEF